MNLSSYKLSIIIPLLNEEKALPPLLAMLEQQKGVCFETIFVDGGSNDRTEEIIRTYSAQTPFPVSIIKSGSGRGRQMNAGARTATGDFLLFLHADSLFKDQYALNTGVTTLSDYMRGTGKEAAARFSLRFNRTASPPSPALYYYESKARLNRRDCIHGDQGFLLPRHLFVEIALFNESLPVLEDDDLVQKVCSRHKWILIESDIYTSARRFEVEGLFERQCLNSLIKNFHAIGWEPFLQEVPGIYQSRNRCRGLHLLPFFKKIRDLLRPLPLRERCRLWCATGGYVLTHAWEPAFVLDTLHNHKKGLPPGKGKTPLLTLFDRCGTRPLNTLPGKWVTTLFVWIWFYATFLYLQLTATFPWNHHQFPET